MIISYSHCDFKNTWLRITYENKRLIKVWESLEKKLTLCRLPAETAYEHFAKKKEHMQV